MHNFTSNANKLIENKRFQISNLEREIRQICFDFIEKQKNIKVGDLIFIPSKNKYAIFVDLHNEEISNQVIKTHVLTKQAMPSKNITTVSLNDLEKVNDKLENIIKTNFSSEELDKNKAISAYQELIHKIKK